MNAARYILDRIENGSWGVLENAQGHTFRVPLSWLPPAVSEGDVVVVEHERFPPKPEEGAAQEHGLRIRVDPRATRERAENAAARRARLRKAPGGDIEL